MTTSSKAIHPPKQEAEGWRREEGLVARFSTWYFCGAAGWWVVIGLVMVLAAFDDTLLDHERMLKWPDVVFEFSTRNVLLLAGGFHLVLGGVLFVIRDSLTKVLLVGWGCSVCALYRLGVSWLSPAWVKPGEPCPVSRLTADKIGIHPQLFGWSWGVILGALVVGAILVMILERRQRKRREDAEFMEHWRKTHKDGGPFPWAG